MGAYVNPPGNTTKEKWLEENAERISLAEAAKISQNLSGDSNHMAVCLVDNGPFTAAGICFEENEFEAFSREEDHRPKWWYKANIENLKEVSDEIEKYMKHAEPEFQS